MNNKIIIKKKKLKQKGLGAWLKEYSFCLASTNP
jgi:hypothetical protein